MEGGGIGQSVCCGSGGEIVAAVVAKMATTISGHIREMTTATAAVTTTKMGTVGMAMTFSGNLPSPFANYKSRNILFGVLLFAFAPTLAVAMGMCQIFSHVHCRDRSGRSGSSVGIAEWLA